MIATNIPSPTQASRLQPTPPLSGYVFPASQTSKEAPSSGVTVLRTAANPVHQNHVDMVSAVLKQVGGSVLVSPSEGTGWGKKELAPFKLRVLLWEKMLDALIPKELRSRVSVVENDQPFLEQFNKPEPLLKFIQDHFDLGANERPKLVIGTDRSGGMVRKKVFKIAPPTLFDPVVMEREDHPLPMVEHQIQERLARLSGAQLTRVKSPSAEPLSSTKIRNLLKAGNEQGLSQFYPSEILDFLLRHQRDFIKF